ncbi:MAG: glycylpeptide N-tetradecanoyltransferase 2-like [Hyperionvirus sp.]|uniref:glycylpeptide N-tetradecanoyltransferase n=1 Tax=Hyperionvirus sp. TaxID=2487770 RepID=A0A3G5A5D3_9VIRU|nr:MAG: glycylpeptide N-tetradecanoyltransferase 2-like [Hyperionvirus sp.]
MEKYSSLHKFWDKQPSMSLIDNTAIEDGPIEKDFPVGTELTVLPDKYYWSEADLTDDNILQELFEFLNDNYIEDTDGSMRFTYSKEFLKWSLLVSGYNPEWHLTVRYGSKGKLLAFITAIPCSIRINDTQIKTVEINYLCIHKNLRNKRLAPVLIKEIIRRVSSKGIQQAIYTIGKEITKPIGITKYWHRDLNPKKLIEIGFSYLPPNQSMNQRIRLYKLPLIPQLSLRPLTLSDIPEAYALLNQYLNKFKLRQMFTLEEFTHFFLPKTDIIYTYVLETNSKITDLCSFFSLSSQVLNNTKYSEMKGAYSFYNIASSVPLKDLINDAMILAKTNGFDVYNALDVMDNELFFKDLKFKIGTGGLQYYLYNWRCSPLQPNEISIILF